MAKFAIVIKINDKEAAYVGANDNRVESVEEARCFSSVSAAGKALGNFICEKGESLKVRRVSNGRYRKVDVRSLPYGRLNLLAAGWYR